MDRNRKKKDAAENPNRARMLCYVNIIFLCTLTLVSLLFALVVYFRLRTRGTDGVRKMYTEKQISNIRDAAAEKEKKDLLLRIQTSLESGRSTTRVFREIFDDSIVVVKDGRYYFYPMDDAVERNPLAPASLVRDGERIRYEGAAPAVGFSRGVLLCDENGKVDWERLAGSGIAEVTVRAGTLTAAGFVPDSQFTRNCRNAAERELRIRLSIDLPDPAPEHFPEDTADAVLRTAHESGVRDPAVILRVLPAEGVPGDVDPESADSGENPAGREEVNGAELKKEWTDTLRSLCDRIAEAGGTPVIGAGLYTFAAQIDLQDLGQYDRWLTDHEETASFPYRFSFWEYSAEGNTEGVPAASVLYVHLNIPDSGAQEQ